MAARVSVDTDSWWHLRAGQWISENGRILQTDLFSYTRYGQPWQYPGWLAELPMYWIYRALGPGGLNIWTAIMVILTFYFVWRTLKGGPLLRAILIILAATVSGVYWAARPYLVTFLLAAVFLWILDAFRWMPEKESARRLLWLPFLMVIWANSHGGFAVGFLIWGVYLAGALWQWMRLRWMDRREDANPPAGDGVSAAGQLTWLAGTGLLLVLAVCANPSGPLLLLYPFKTVGIGALQDYIQEWQSPNFHQLKFQPFAWMIFAELAALGISRRRLALTDFLLTAGFAYLGLMAARNIALFALTAPPVIARHAAPVVDAFSRRIGFRGFRQIRPTRAQALLNWLLLGVLLIAVLARAALIMPQSVNEEAFADTLPVHAVEAIRQEAPPGRIFNSYNWGGYLIWNLPEYPVFLDGRTDLYNDEIIGQWLQAARAEPGWQEILDLWEVRLVLLEANMPLSGKLGANGWHLVYQDDLAVVYSR